MLSMSSISTSDPFVIANICKNKLLGFCGTSLDVENFLKSKCVLVSSGNIIHMSKF